MLSKNEKMNISAFVSMTDSAARLALAQEPELLLLDEPTTYLDIRHQLDLMLLVGQLHRELGLTVVMVLHDLLAT